MPCRRIWAEGCFVWRTKDPPGARTEFGAGPPPPPSAPRPFSLTTAPPSGIMKLNKKRPGKGRLSLWLCRIPPLPCRGKTAERDPKKERILNQEGDDGLRRWNFGQRSRCDEHDPHLGCVGDFDPWCAVTGFGRHFAASGAGYLAKQKGRRGLAAAFRIVGIASWPLAGTRLLC